MDKKSEKAVKKAPKPVLKKKPVAKPVTKKMPEKKVVKAPDHKPITKAELKKGLGPKKVVKKPSVPITKPVEALPDPLAVKKILRRADNTAAAQQYDKAGAKFYLRDGRQSLRSWLRERFKWPQEKLIAAAREAGYYPGLTDEKLIKKLEDYRYHVEWEMTHGKIKTTTGPATDAKIVKKEEPVKKTLLKNTKEAKASPSRSAGVSVAPQKGKKQTTVPKAKTVPAGAKKVETAPVVPAPGTKSTGAGVPVGAPQIPVETPSTTDEF